MNVRKIVQSWLLVNNFEGLAGSDCGCSAEDLMPCDNCACCECSPGYKIRCRDCGDEVIVENLQAKYDAYCPDCGVKHGR